MYDALYAPFQCRGYWYYESAVAQSGCHILLDESFALCCPQYVVECAGDASFRLLQLRAYLCEPWRGAVLYVSVLVEYLVDAAYHVAESEYALGESVQSGVVVVAVVVASAEKAHDGGYRFERTAQVEDFVLFEMCAFYAYALYRFTHVEEELQREVVGFFLQSSELSGLS